MLFKGTGKTSLLTAFVLAIANINSQIDGIAPKILILPGQRAKMSVLGVELHKLRTQLSSQDGRQWSRLDFVYICSSEQLPAEIHGYDPYRKYAPEDKENRDKRFKDARIILCPKNFTPFLNRLVVSFIIITAIFFPNEI